MKINTIVNRYLLKELTQPFLITLLFFTFLFMLGETFKVARFIVLYRIGLLDVLLMLFLTTPTLLKFILPMSVMMAVLLMFLRLSSDNEIIALKTSGVSIYKLLPPVILLAVIGFALSLFMSLYATQWAKLSIRELKLKVASSNLNIGLKERTFNDRFKKVMLYVNEIDYKTKALIDVFIEDQRKEGIISIVVAPKGMLYGEPDMQKFHLKLFNGTINQVSLDNRSINTVHFDNYDLTLDIHTVAPIKKKRKRKEHSEMSYAELRQYIDNKINKKDFDDNYYKANMELHVRFSIPAACFALGLLAVPLGLSLRTAKRYYGLAIGLVLFWIYYVLLSIGLAFGEYGLYPPVVAMWLPNVIMGALGIFLLIRVANEKPFGIQVIAQKLRRRLLLWKGGAPASAMERPAPNEKKEEGGVTQSAPFKKSRLPKEWRFAGSLNSDVFHRSDCKWIKGLDPEDLTGFESREQAVREGWLPCKTCRP
jgi:lipopolysaccharide export system permease protein